MEEQEIQEINNQKEPRNKKKIILIILGAVIGVTILIMVGAFVLNNYIYKEKQTENPQTLVDQNPVIYFKPSTLDLTSGQISIPIVQIMGDIPNPADTIKIDIEYDPLTMSDVQISPITEGTSVLGNDALVVTNTPNYQSGRAFFEIQTPQPVSGNGPIALLTFTPNPSSPVTTTEITFTTGTQVANSAGSTYQTATMNLDIILPSNSTNSSQNIAPDAQERLLQQQQELAQ